VKMSGQKQEFAGRPAIGGAMSRVRSTPALSPMLPSFCDAHMPADSSDCVRWPSATHHGGPQTRLLDRANGVAPVKGAWYPTCWPCPGFLQIQQRHASRNLWQLLFRESVSHLKAHASEVTKPAKKNGENNA
jgi:hypothetical protein